MQNASSFKRDEFKRNDFTQAVIAKKQSKAVKKICHDSSILSIDSAALGLKNYVMFEEFIISRNEGSSMNYIKALRNAEQRFKCFILENNPRIYMLYTMDDSSPIEFIYTLVSQNKFKIFTDKTGNIAPIQWFLEDIDLLFKIFMFDPHIDITDGLLCKAQGNIESASWIIDYQPSK